MAIVKYKVNEDVVQKIKQNNAAKYLVDITDECVEEAKKLCPVDSGKLQQSIETSISSWDKTSYGSDVEYARMVEFGTRNQAAQPFLRPATSIVKSKHNN